MREERKGRYLIRNSKKRPGLDKYVLLLVVLSVSRESPSVYSFHEPEGKGKTPTLEWVSVLYISAIGGLRVTGFLRLNIWCLDQSERVTKLKCLPESPTHYPPLYPAV